MTPMAAQHLRWATTVDNRWSTDQKAVLQDEVAICREMLELTPLKMAKLRAS
jgi:hypothetical protein